MKKRSWIVMAAVFLAVLIAANFSAAAGVRGAEVDNFSSFEVDLDEIRQILKIPGMSAAIVQDQKLLWAKGFGFADLENQVAAAPDTPYGLASVTKPVAAVLIMQLVAEGDIDLDAPVAQYGVHIANSQGVVTVRHLLTHTSEGIPGTVYHYNGDRYSQLSGVIEGATGRTFAELLSERILTPLEMYDTALNPVSLWQGAPRFGLDDFKRLVGVGDSYRHYPDVFLRQAKPYQLDEAYEIIPGMLHQHHNTAAGLVSSVADLAKFDIALDQGVLLGEAIKNEMFAPAYSTYENHVDLNYGLGWYVQDYEGLRLLWHTGRWPPSTSALYLKVPELNLTFIVLANTDNLTVPFYGVGNGDVTKSTLALAFIRHFVYPRLYSSLPPAVDWVDNQSVLVKALSGVEDRTARSFLERELWSYRQAFASTGNVDQVKKLERVRAQVFRDSIFQNDILFTTLPGKYPVISPVLSTAIMVWLGRAAAVWLGLVGLSLIWMAAVLWKPGDQRSPYWVLWLLAALFFGPIAVLVNALLSKASKAMALPVWKQAVGAALIAISGYSAAWVVTIFLVFNLPEIPGPLLVLLTPYVVGMVIGVLFIRMPAINRLGGAKPGKVWSRCFLAELLAINVGFPVLFSLTMVVTQHVFSMVPYPTNPYFWIMMSGIALVGFGVMFPLQLWLKQRGYAIWVSSSVSSLPVEIVLPTMQDAWPVLVVTFVFMVGLVAMTISVLPG